MITIEASYFTVRALLPSEPVVHRTVEVRPDLLVDVDSHGRVLGIECVGGSVGVDELCAVLRRAVLSEEGT